VGKKLVQPQFNKNALNTQNSVADSRFKSSLKVNISWLICFKPQAKILRCKHFRFEFNDANLNIVRKKLVES